MTATLPRIDPFTDAECRRPGRNPRWWDDGASKLDRVAAAEMCKECPALIACGDAAESLGLTASGTWAGVYRVWQPAPQVDDETLAEFLTVFGPPGPSNDNPPPTRIEQPAKPARHGRYWVHPSQLEFEYQEAN